MRFSPVRSMLLLVALVVFPAGQLFAQNPPDSATVLESSGLIFRVLGTEPGSFVIATPDGTQAVSYDLSAARFSFQTFDFVDDGNPLFCFDFSGNGAGGPTLLRLNVVNSSGHPVLDSVSLTFPLQYRAGGGEISFTPGAGIQCFYIGDGGESAFGLFGALPPSEPEPPDPTPDPDRLFHDGFELEVNPGLRVRFEDVPQAVTAGGTLSYALVLENTGDTGLGTVAFQEAFPGNAHVFPAALAAGSWSCHGSACPASSGTGVIRSDGVALPVGEFIRFEISRPVDAAAEGGSHIELYAGAVNGSGANASFGADQAAVSVIGAPARVVFVNDTTAVAIGQEKTISIEIQDDSGNLVATDSRVLELSKLLGSGSGRVDPMSGLIAVTNGVSSFEVTGTVAGSLTLAARTVPGEPTLQTGTTSFTVTAP